MKVALINPPSPDGKKFVREGRCEQRASSFEYLMVPISLPSIAGLLEQRGHEVIVIDCVAENFQDAELIGILKEFDPGLLILNLAIATFHSDVKTIENLNDSFPGIHKTAISIHVSVMPEEVLNACQLNSVIRREPEETAAELADVLQDSRDISGIKGISYKTLDGIAHNPDRPFIEDLDQLPFPSRKLLKNEKYTLPFSNRPYTLLISSRGCPHSCIYCTAHQYYGKKLRLRSVENIVEEIEEILKLGLRDITMWSDTFTMNKPFVEEVCREIIKRKLKFNWMTNSRVDTVDEDLFKIMREAGCEVVSFGIESGSQKILNQVKKGIKVEEIKSAMLAAKKARVKVAAHIVFGLPGETESSVKETIGFLKKMDPDYAQFYCAVPFPGTEFYDMALKNGWLTTEDWSRFEINQAIVSTDLLSEKQLATARERAYREFYFRPTFILKRLSDIKSMKDLVTLPKKALDFVRDWVKVN